MHLLITLLLLLQLRLLIALGAVSLPFGVTSRVHRQSVLPLLLAADLGFRLTFAVRIVAVLVPDEVAISIEHHVGVLAVALFFGRQDRVPILGVVLVEVLPVYLPLRLLAQVTGFGHDDGDAEEAADDCEEEDADEDDLEPVRRVVIFELVAPQLYELLGPVASVRGVDAIETTSPISALTGALTHLDTFYCRALELITCTAEKESTNHLFADSLEL